MHLLCLMLRCELGILPGRVARRMKKVSTKTKPSSYPIIRRKRDEHRGTDNMTHYFPTLQSLLQGLPQECSNGLQPSTMCARSRVSRVENIIIYSYELTTRFTCTTPEYCSLFRISLGEITRPFLSHVQFAFKTFSYLPLESSFMVLHSRLAIQATGCDTVR